MQAVVHLVSADESERETALTVLENMLDAETSRIGELALVAQADGIASVLNGGVHEADVRSLLDRGVEVSACENSLDSIDLAASDLIDGVETVPEGAVEVTRLQNQGYAYLRP